MELQENKLKSLTLQEKLELIAIIEAGRSVKDVAEEYAVNRNTLHYILKNREKIRAGINAQPGISGFKRIKKTKCPELEKRVLEFMYESREKNEKLSGSSIKAMALEFASELQVENFSASNGWLFAFFKRNQITISEFNKNVGPQHETPLKEVTDKTIIDEEPYEDELTENVSDDLARIEEVSYDYSSNNELFETVEEEEQKLELTDSSWRSWCRMCGDYDTLPVLDSPNIEVVQQLFDISIDEDFKVCEKCNVALKNIVNIVSKGKAVESMLMEIQERETHEELTQELLMEIRRDFGFEFDIYEGSSQEEAVEESEGFEEIIYESLDLEPEDFKNSGDEIKEEVEVEREEHVEFEVMEDESMEYIEGLESLQGIDQETKDEYVFKCHLCDIDAFQHMHLLSNHTRIEHQSLPKVACSCGRFLSTWESLMNHKRKHSSQQNTFKCNECTSSFRTKTGLSIHVKFKHERPTKVNICPTCGREFKDSTVLKTHMRTHLPDEEKFAFECEICGKRMANKWSVKYHISTIHEQQKSHFCHICDRGFGNKSNLRSHLISHSTENVECEICGNRFKNRISLQSHRKIHKPEHMRKFSCTVCSKSFHSRNHLARHMTAHSDERRHKCPFQSCMSEYKWQKDLTNHIASVHTGERLHKCLWCDRSFADSANARKHKLREHPEDLREFEAHYGKGRRIEQLFPDQVVIVEAE